MFLPITRYIDLIISLLFFHKYVFKETVSILMRLCHQSSMFVKIVEFDIQNKIQYHLEILINYQH